MTTITTQGSFGVHPPGGNRFFPKTCYVDPPKKIYASTPWRPRRNYCSFSLLS
jgi:hypothetical protein